MLVKPQCIREMQTYEESLELFIRVVLDAASRVDIELLVSLWKETSVLPEEDKKRARQIFDECANEIGQSFGLEMNESISFISAVNQYDVRRISRECKKDVIVVKNFILQCKGNRIAWFFLHYFKNHNVPENILVDTIWIAIEKFHPKTNFFPLLPFNHCSDGEPVHITDYIYTILVKSLSNTGQMQNVRDMSFYTKKFAEKCVENQNGNNFVIWFNTFWPYTQRSCYRDLFLNEHIAVDITVSPILTKENLIEMFRSHKANGGNDLFFSELVSDKLVKDITILNDFVKAGCSENLKYAMIHGLLSRKYPNDEQLDSIIYDRVIHHNMLGVLVSRVYSSYPDRMNIGAIKSLIQNHGYDPKFPFDDGSYTHRLLQRFTEEFL